MGLVALFMVFVVVAFEHYAELLTGEVAAKYQVTVAVSSHQSFSNRPINRVFGLGRRNTGRSALFHFLVGYIVTIYREL